MAGAAEGPALGSPDERQRLVQLTERMEQLRPAAALPTAVNRRSVAVTEGAGAPPHRRGDERRAPRCAPRAVHASHGGRSATVDNTVPRRVPDVRMEVVNLVAEGDTRGRAVPLLGAAFGCLARSAGDGQVVRTRQLGVIPLSSPATHPLHGAARLVAVRQHPAEQAQRWPTAPALVGAPTRSAASGLQQARHRRRPEVRGGERGQRASHRSASRSCSTVGAPAWPLGVW